jgi:hypothetical protein
LPDMSPSFTEIREWFQFSFVVVGGTIALSAYFQNQRQRRLENALKLLALFKDSLRENDLEHWKALFVGTCEPASAPPGHFISRDGRVVPLDVMWSEGSEDDDAIQRMAESFEIICYEILSETVEARIVWFEIGQLMSEMHKWLTHVDAPEKNGQFLARHYPSIKEVFEKYAGKFEKWPRRIHAQFE